MVETETDSDFITRMYRAIPYSTHLLKNVDLTRLLTLARRGAEVASAWKPATEADWFWRDLDPDDSGDTVSEALRYMPDNVVCAISSSFKGPSFFAARVPVLDPESDDTEEICAKTEAECLAAVKERLAARAALPQPAEQEKRT